MVNFKKQTTDVFDLLLNDVVEFHVQVVNQYHRNLAGAEIQKCLVIVAGFWPPSPRSGQPRFRQPEWPNFDFRPFGRDLAKTRPRWLKLASSGYKIEMCFIIL